MENDLISRKALLDTLQNHFGQDLAYLGEDLQYCQEAVQFAPAVEAEPVRHGRWVPVSLIDHKGRVLMEQYKCSECGRMEDNKQPYCHCGAKMDAKEDDHE